MRCDFLVFGFSWSLPLVNYVNKLARSLVSRLIAKPQILGMCLIVALKTLNYKKIPAAG